MGYGEGNHKEKPLSIFRIQYPTPLSLSAVSPPRLASDEIYGYGNLGAAPVGPYTANNFPAPIAEDLRTRRRKKGSRSLIGQGDVSVSIGNNPEGLQTTCALCFPCHTRAPPHVSHLCVMIHAKERTRYVKSVSRVWK